MEPDELAQTLDNIWTYLQRLEAGAAGLHVAVTALIETHPQYDQFQLALARKIDSPLPAQLLLAATEEQRLWLQSTLEAFQRTNAARSIEIQGLIKPKP